MFSTVARVQSYDIATCDPEGFPSGLWKTVATVGTKGLVRDELKSPSFVWQEGLLVRVTGSDGRYSVGAFRANGVVVDLQCAGRAMRRFDWSFTPQAATFASVLSWVEAWAVCGDARWMAMAARRVLAPSTLTRATCACVRASMGQIPDRLRDTAREVIGAVGRVTEDPTAIEGLFEVEILLNTVDPTEDPMEKGYNTLDALYGLIAMSSLVDSDQRAYQATEVIRNLAELIPGPTPRRDALRALADALRASVSWRAIVLGLLA